jgi:hypothetical protein
MSPDTSKSLSKKVGSKLGLGFILGQDGKKLGFKCLRIEKSFQKASQAV